MNRNLRVLLREYNPLCDARFSSATLHLATTLLIESDVVIAIAMKYI